MKKFKKIGSVLLIWVMVLGLVGCVRMDIGVEINDDGTGSLTAKMSIEESAYNELVSMGEIDEDDAGDYKKEKIDGKTYYSITETEKYESLEDIADALEDLECIDGSQIFENVKIKEKDGGKKFTITFETPVIENPTEGMGYGDEEDWLVVTLTVKMPGKIADTNGEKQKRNTVCFTLDDFSDEAEYHAESVATSPVGTIIIVVVGVAVAAGATVFLLNLKKKKEAQAAEEQGKTEE